MRRVRFRLDCLPLISWRLVRNDITTQSVDDCRMHAGFTVKIREISNVVYNGGAYDTTQNLSTRQRMCDLWSCPIRNICYIYLYICINSFLNILKNCWDVFPLLQMRTNVVRNLYYIYAGDLLNKFVWVYNSHLLIYLNILKL